MSPRLAAYHITDPYPVPVNLAPNSQTAQLLSQAYAGLHSELSALTQYVVHHQACAANAQVSQALLCIAMVEMHHLDMLGGCLRQLGGSVELQAAGEYWSGKNAVCGGTMTERLAMDIEGEQQCIALYEQIMARSGNPALNALLARIAEDEALHIVRLEQLLECVTPEE